MIDFGELRSAVENCRYEDLLDLVSSIPSRYHDWFFAKMPWMNVPTFNLLCVALWDILVEGKQEQIASVVYLILAGGHREHWMRYAMACLRGVEHESTNAADLVWWMCSHAPDLHKRILDAGHTCDAELVWEFLAQFAYWELVRPEDDGGYQSPGCTAYGKRVIAVFASWPHSQCVANWREHRDENWGVFVSKKPSIVDNLTGWGMSAWRSTAATIVEATRKAMEVGQ